MMREMLATFGDQMDRLHRRMDSLKRERGAPSLPNTLVRSRDPPSVFSNSRSHDSLYELPRLWVDRPLKEPLPPLPLVWPDDDVEVQTNIPDGAQMEANDNDGCTLHKVTKPTSSLLGEAFSKPVINAMRRRWRLTYEMPALYATKSPKLDMLWPQISKEAKEADRSLGQLQGLLLDAVGPLTNVLELQQAGHLTTDTATEAVTQALHFLGNAHANISSERRKKIVGHLNKDLRPLVEEADRFTSSAPYLFGREFEKAAKDHVDSVHSMQKLSAPSGNSRQGQFFRQGCPNQAPQGGGHFHGSSRGGGRGHFRPYQTATGRTAGQETATSRNSAAKPAHYS